MYKHLFNEWNDVVYMVQVQMYLTVAEMVSLSITVAVMLDYTNDI